MIILYSTIRNENILKNVVLNYLGFYKIYSAMEKRRKSILKKLNKLYLTSIFAKNYVKVF